MYVVKMSTKKSRHLNIPKPYNFALFFETKLLQLCNNLKNKIIIIMNALSLVQVYFNAYILL